MRRGPLRLVVFAAFALGALMFILRPAAHDPMWWRHAGIPELRWSDTPISLIHGVHYLADYDVSAITMPDRYKIAESKQRFHYAPHIPSRDRPLRAVFLPTSSAEARTLVPPERTSCGHVADFCCQSRKPQPPERTSCGLTDDFFCRSRKPHAAGADFMRPYCRLLLPKQETSCRRSGLQAALLPTSSTEAGFPHRVSNSKND